MVKPSGRVFPGHGLPPSKMSNGHRQMPKKMRHPFIYATGLQPPFGRTLRREILTFDMVDFSHPPLVYRSSNKADGPGKSANTPLASRANPL